MRIISRRGQRPLNFSQFHGSRSLVVCTRSLHTCTGPSVCTPRFSHPRLPLRWTQKYPDSRGLQYARLLRPLACMDSIEDDAVARRREQNRLAQRRFRCRLLCPLLLSVSRLVSPMGEDTYTVTLGTLPVSVSRLTSSTEEEVYTAKLGRYTYAVDMDMQG